MGDGNASLKGQSLLWNGKGLIRRLHADFQTVFNVGIQRLPKAVRCNDWLALWGEVNIALSDVAHVTENSEI